MNLAHLMARRFAPVEQAYGARDCALYALALGIGSDPLDEDELPYVYEGRPQTAVPSQCVTLGWPAFWQDDPATGIDWVHILHGEQHFQLHRRLPASAGKAAGVAFTQALDQFGAKRAARHGVDRAIDGLVRDGGGVGHEVQPAADLLRRAVQVDVAQDELPIRGDAGGIELAAGVGGGIATGLASALGDDAEVARAAGDQAALALTADGAAMNADGQGHSGLGGACREHGLDDQAVVVGDVVAVGSHEATR